MAESAPCSTSSPSGDLAAVSVSETHHVPQAGNRPSVPSGEVPAFVNDPSRIRSVYLQAVVPSQACAFSGRLTLQRGLLKLPISGPHSAFRKLWTGIRTKGSVLSDSKGIFLFNQKLHALLRLLILKNIGFSEESVFEQVFQQSRRYAYAKINHAERVDRTSTRSVRRLCLGAALSALLGRLLGGCRDRRCIRAYRKRN